MAFLLAGHGRDLLEEFRVALAEASAKPGEKHIHGLRVRMKKLRSLLRLADAMDTGNTAPKGAMRRMKALFKAAGEHRELVISAVVVAALATEDGQEAEAYLLHLGTRERKALKALRRALQDVREKDIVKLRSHLSVVANAQTRSQERRTARNHVDREMRKARQLVQEGARGEALHDVRKHLKNAWHTLRLLGDADTLTERQGDLLQRLGSIQESLGEWHDLQVVYDDLAGLAQQDEVAVLKKAIGSKLRTQRTRLMRELRVLLPA